MKSSEECLESFRALKAEVGKYSLSQQTEADTRARIIDRMLAEVLDWPPESIKREEHAHPGFMDYVFLVGRRIAVLEAKKAGDTFLLPHDVTTAQRSFTLAGVIRKVANLQEYINQATAYCLNNGIEYAIISNGIQYVVFRAVRIDGIHRGRGRVAVFNGLDDIDNRFIPFWELLSKSSVEGGSLQRVFDETGTPALQYRRVADQVHAVKEKVSRNALSADLEPLIAEYMGEIAGESSREKLRRLFVKSRELDSVLNAVHQRIAMNVSSTVRHAARIVEPASIPELKASIEEKVRKHVAVPQRGEAILLLGRVGSGKTTFMSHFLQIEAGDVFKQHLLVLLDFRSLEPGGNLRKFFYDELRSSLAKNKTFSDLTGKQLRRVYAPEIRELTIGPLAVLEKQNKKKYEEKISDYLMERFSDTEIHYPRVLRFLADKLGVRCFLLFDNVDQHSFDFQQEIFQFAHSFSTRCHAFSIVTMWEETFLRSKQAGGALAAYQNFAYRFAPTSVVDIISRRLEYIVDEVQRGGLARDLIPDESRAGDISDFLGLVRESILHDHRRARQFLESISMGNLRKAIEIFNSFLVSGHTDAGKILSTYRTQHSYLIPLHEFIKSVGLGDNRYYSSELSEIANLFSISDESRPSHFTKIRILEHLYSHRNHTAAYGHGFVQLDSILDGFARFGTSAADIKESLRLLGAYLLVENDVYDARVSGNAYRITPAGRYYLRYLSNKFTYLDLVCQDTPIGDPAAFETIKNLVASREMEDRFRRVEAFLSYLSAEEEREHPAIMNACELLALRSKIMPELRRAFESDHQYITKQRRRRRVRPGIEITPYAAKPTTTSA